MAHFNLDNILNYEKWQDLQESLAEVTQLAIITINYKGTPISTHSKCTPFCQEIRNHTQWSKMCEKCDSRAGLEATRNNKPYIYLCHFHIIDIAIPITIDDKYIGAVMAGQVRPVFSGTVPDLEQVLHLPDADKILNESHQLKSLYENIPTLDYDNIVNISTMLFKLCNYIVEEATAKNVLADKYEPLLNPAKTAAAVTLPAISDEKSEFSNLRNQKLRPALEYVRNNTHLMVSLEEAAQLCHLSPCYFSRCFTKEFGMSYTNYTNTIKIEYAKEMLTGTDLTVTEVSDKLGFSDPGYFIKVFKKYEYVTPKLYRKYAL